LIKKITIFLILFLFFSSSTVIAQNDSATFRAQIISKSVETMKIKLEDGKEKDILIDEFNFVSYQKFKKGDKVFVEKIINPLTDEEIFVVTEVIRETPIFILFLLFAFLAILIGKKWGVFSLIGMAFSFLVIFKLILPLILNGINPVFSAILGASFIIPVTFILSHGFNKKTIVAIISTIITLIIVGLLAIYFVDATHLTGFASEEAAFLNFDFGEKINLKGILLAGIIISILGILDDITISQSSIVLELKKANKNLDFWDLFKRAMNVGIDHISSLINTLVLVYTGASLPLLLLFINSKRSFMEVINYEIVADEIVRTLLGSIGLILAVPITTLLASFVFKGKNK